ncbi:MAG TPA: alpha/beta hydrolase-fold protein [Jiangellaceae bacterium]|nr:alpha/beta hydrolase-fold protein [Jiangellaceae bacterium]
MKSSERWYSDRLQQEITLVRWGVIGAPVLLLPTAGGDAEEVERHHLVGACGELLAAGRIKIYSCDGVAGQAMMARIGSPHHRMWLLNQFQQCVRYEMVPAIYADTGGAELPIIAAGASIGAFNALAVLCRFPDVFSHAVCMSGTYDLQPLYEGTFSDDLYYSSPLHFLPDVDGPQLDHLRQRFAVLASGEGEWEDIGETWRVAHVLGDKGVPNRVDPWGPAYRHDWPTWWRMLPQYLQELTPSS